MPEKNISSRVVARVKCLLPTDWLGRAGSRFRQTVDVLSKYSRERLRPKDRLEEAPDLAWTAVEGAAHEKFAKALRDYAEEEKGRIDAELLRRTLKSKVRQESATATRMEAEARTAQIKELDARIELFDKLKKFGTIPMWDKDGNIRVTRTQKECNWDGINNVVVETSDMSTMDSFPSDGPVDFQEDVDP